MIGIAITGTITCSQEYQLPNPLTARLLAQAISINNEINIIVRRERRKDTHTALSRSPRNEKFTLHDDATFAGEASCLKINHLKKLSNID